MVIPDDQIKAILIREKILDESVWEEVVKSAKANNHQIVRVLVEKGIVKDERLGELLAQELKLPFVNLSKLTIPEEIFSLIPERLARKQKAVVFARDKEGIKLAMYHPGRTEIADAISKKTNTPVKIYFATSIDIESTLRLYKQDLQRAIEDLLNEDISHSQNTEASDPPVARIIDLLIDTAYDGGASDVHIEPQEEHSTVRFRIDGILHEVARVSKFLHDRIITRIKVLSNLRTDEHLSAQDGKMQSHMEEEQLDIRVSIVPTVNGEKSVLRLLSSQTHQLTLADLGMNADDLAKMEKAYKKPYGMILSTGPTGSGKTTTIYSILRVLNVPEKNITSIEDPVEYRIGRANQIQVNTKTNLTFANGLRSILRQDPNIIFVGEIRDNETAGIAVNAALTGHLVLSTLHTNDAATALPRLSDMKVEPFLVASTVSIIVAQRLVRKICEKCKAEIEIPYTELQKNFPNYVLIATDTKADIKGFKGNGCKLCNSTGYAGRLGLYEILEMTPQIRKLVVEKKDSDVIAVEAIRNGMKTMAMDGLLKVKSGLTTIEEVLRATKTESS